MRLIIFLLLLSNSTYCQNINNASSETIKDTIPTLGTFIKAGSLNDYKGYFYKPYKFSGSLKNVLANQSNISPKRIFCKNMPLIKDSIQIDMELQYELLGSEHVEELLINSLQRAYQFHFRDTILSELDTLYLVKVIDESKLQKTRIDEHTFLTVHTDTEMRFLFKIYQGKQLNIVSTTLSSVKTREKLIDNISIPIHWDKPFKYTGFYNFAIPISKLKDITTEEDSYFNTLMDINPHLFNYGLQVQKVIRPAMGKVIEFFEIPYLEVPMRFEYKF